MVGIIQTADTQDELDALEALMHLLMPSARLYVQAGTLGTQADRLEAMQELRHRAYQRVSRCDPDTNAAGGPCRGQPLSRLGGRRMALVAIPGTGLWLPPLPSGILGSNVRTAADVTLDADEEELQLIFSVTIPGGGTKTFGTAGSSLSWASGAAITFGAGDDAARGGQSAE